MAEPVPVQRPELASGARVLAGKFEVLERISRGAFGQVLKVRQDGLEKVFAAKIVTADSASPESFKRLAREAQILSKLQHENIVKVHSAAVDEKLGLVVVMEYLDGTPLSKLVPGGLPVEVVLDLARQICAGLAYAHENGIAHRDLKPSNVMVIEQDGKQQAVLIDFGIAKLQDATQKLTQTGSMLGTPIYMSPEQFSGRPVDVRSDIYSFGCVLYEMLVGAPPFNGDSAVELAAKHLSEPAPLMSDSKPDVPGDLEDIVQRCLAKEPDHRYQHVSEIVEALQHCKLTPRPPAKRRPRHGPRIDWRRMTVPLVVLGAMVAAGCAAAMIAHNRPQLSAEDKTHWTADLERAKAELYKGDYDDAAARATEISNAYKGLADSNELRTLATKPLGLSTRTVYDAFVVSAKALLNKRDPDAFDGRKRLSDSLGPERDARFLSADVADTFTPNEYGEQKMTLTWMDAEAHVGSPHPLEAVRDIGDLDHEVSLMAKGPNRDFWKVRMLVLKAEFCAVTDQQKDARALASQAERLLEAGLPELDSAYRDEQILWTKFMKRRLAWLRRAKLI